MDNRLSGSPSRSIDIKPGSPIKSIVIQLGFP